MSEPKQLLLDQAAVITVALVSTATTAPEGPMSEARWAEVRALRDQARQGGPTQPRRPGGYAWHCSGDRGADLVAIEQALLAEQRALRLAQSAGGAGTATAGTRGTATAGDGGVLSILWWDEAQRKLRRKVGVVGEDGLEPGKRYRVEGGQFVEVAP